MQTHPVIERYLGSFAAAFDEFEVSDRDEIVQNPQSHRGVAGLGHDG